MYKNEKYENNYVKIETCQYGFIQSLENKLLW